MTTSPVTTLTDELIAELDTISKYANLVADGESEQEYLSSLAGRSLREISRLRAENAELKRDAERYRWLANNSAIIHSQFCEAIDAAMQNQ